MKKNCIYVFLLSLMIMAGCFGLFTACGGGEDGKTQPEQLSAPIVILQEDIASWGINDKATRFEISINGSLSYVENSVISKQLDDGQTLKVRAIGDGVNYLDSVWSNTVTYRASAVVEKYTVTWKNGDVILETDVDIEEGTLPIYNGITPTKEKDAQYTYTFSGWSPEVSTVTSDITYFAQFSSTLNKYTVVWKNDDNVIETDENVNYGTTPVYNGATPTKPSDNENIYVFSGWSPAISTVVDNITYVAQFTSRANNCVVIFYDENGITEIGRAVVGYGETAIYPNSLPAKEPTVQYSYEFDKWVTEIGGNIEATLTNITADTSIYAKFVQSVREYSVKFCDYDGTSLSEINVKYGESATAPEVVLEREGYRFDGWDKSLDNITSDITITAKYVKQYKVEFIDYDGTIIYSDEVDESDDFINMPENPSRAYYEFIGWDITDFSNVHDNIVANALYIRTYQVEFIDYNGILLKKETVRLGASATAPESLTRIEYDFTGWDKDFSVITSDLTVKAQYKIKTYTVRFIDAKGEILKTEEVRHGFNATAPNIDETYFDWDLLKGFRFTKWSNQFDRITSNIDIVAEYNQEIIEPIIVVRNKTVEIGTMTAQVEVFICCSSKFYGVSLDMNFAKELIQQGKQATTVTVSNGFGVEAIEGEGNYTSKFKDDCNYEFRWTNGDGIEPNGLPISILTFNLSLSEFQQEGEYCVNILEGTYIIDNNLTKVNPVIISGNVTID